MSSIAREKDMTEQGVPVVARVNMCYTSSCHTNGFRGVLFFKTDAIASSEYLFWAKRPVLSDSRPAVCVTAMADNTGRFSMNRKVSQVCPTCGKEFSYPLSRLGRKVFCSKECQNRSNQAENTCVGCGKNFSVCKSRASEYRYCSAECKEKFTRSVSHCEQCGEAYSHHKYRDGKTKYCSRACRDKARTTGRNPLAAMIHSANRRARKSEGGGAFTASEFRQLCNRYNNRCLACGRTGVKLEADHVVPVSLGGSSDISNIQPLCVTCNRQKYTKTTDYRIG